MTRASTPTLLAAALALAACKQGAPEPPAGEPAIKPAAPTAAEPATSRPATSRPSYPVKAHAATAADKIGTLPEGVGLAPGSKVPDVALKTHLGEPVQLAHVIKSSSPLLLIFYRGGW